MTLRIPLNFDDVQDEFDVLDAGVYSAVIEKLVYTPEREVDGETKNPSIRVEYTLTEPGSEGRKLSQWLYPTPKAIFRVKAFFDVFESDLDELVLDEEPDERGGHLVREPNLSGEAVEVKVKKVPKWGDPDRDDNKVDDAPVRLGRKRKAAAAKAKPAASDEDEEDAEPAPRRRGGRPIR